MNGERSLLRTLLHYATHVGLPAAAVLAAGAYGGCLARPIAPIDPRTTSTVNASVNNTGIEKIDILLMIDNSSSMGDKQAVLQEAIPLLVGRLVDPYCVQVESDGGLGGTPVKPPCADGYTPEFKPITDIHIGVVTSSLGGHGADACPTTANTCNGDDNPSNNDWGHLVSRKSAEIVDAGCDVTEIQPNTVTTTGNLGFLAWDPLGKYNLTPPSYQGPTADNLLTALGDLVKGVGDTGCGFESQLEGWYRFLIEPEPWTSIAVTNNAAVKSGTDYALLQQRAQFLRPDSLVAIIGLTDENDASIRDGDLYWVGARKTYDPRTPFHLWRPASICATDPNNACCYSCGVVPPKGCAADPACAPGGVAAYLSGDDDQANLRGWDAKRRFGLDFLYPIERYRAGLQELTVIGSQHGQPLPNPLYSYITEPAGYKAATNKDWIPQAAGTLRTPKDQSVFVAYIAGVPWQDIARDPTDLKKGFKDSDQMGHAIDASGHTTWDVIIGTPITDSSSAYVPSTPGYAPPLDPHMIESRVPRTTLQGIGQNPLFSAPLAPPGSAELADPVNGSEYTVNLLQGTKTTSYDDLEYACIFKLPTPRPCATDSKDCDCGDGTTDRPLCVAGSTSTSPPARTLQKYAKAYPGIREFALLKAVGDQGIVASICPAQLDHRDDVDYGYTPAVNGIVDRLKTKLGGQCLPSKLAPDDTTGEVQCLVLEAKKSNGTCDCPSQPARETPEDVAIRALEMNSDYQAACMPDGGVGTGSPCCVCQIHQLGDPSGVWTPNQCAAAKGTYDNAFHRCECDGADDQTLTGKADGWCYVDSTIPVGSEGLVAKCPTGQKRKVRFAGSGVPSGQTFITCQSK